METKELEIAKAWREQQESAYMNTPHGFAIPTEDEEDFDNAVANLLARYGAEQRLEEAKAIKGLYLSKGHGTPETVQQRIAELERKLQGS